MPNSSPSGSPNDNPRLNAILAEYMKRKDAGTPVDRNAMLQAYPDLADGLRSYFEAEEMMGGIAAAETVRPRTPVPQPPANVRETVRPNTGNSDTASEFHSQSFGRYQLLRPLGEGAMGSVFLAQDTTLDRQVALKIPKTDGKGNVDFMARFSREAKAAAGLKHPNICNVYDAGEHNGTPFITMDFIDGVPLSRFIGSRQLNSVDSILQMVATIAEAVGHAHSKGVIHRDLKPGNILVDAEFQPIVTDFGLARRAGPGNESRITQEGLLIGTPAYMAPEQVKGEQSKVGPRSDIYSLGVMLFEMLTSRLPFEGAEGSIPDMLAQILRDHPPAPGKFRKELPEDVNDLCIKMLKKDPDKRFNSMSDVVTAIGQLRAKLKRAPVNQADVARQQSPFEIQKAHIEQMLKKGQYAAAIQDLEKLAKETLPGAKAVAEWARKTLPGVRAEAKSLNPAGLAALLQTAREMFERHDYPGCIQLLDDIPSLRRSEAMEDLLEKAHSREAEAEQLLSDIKERERTQHLDGIEVLVKRLLKLKPGSAYANRLWEALQTYGKTPATRRQYRFEKGRLQPMPEAGFLKQWAMLGSLVGVLMFLSVYAYVVVNIKSDNQTLAGHVDDDPPQPDPPQPDPPQPDPPQPPTPGPVQMLAEGTTAGDQMVLEMHGHKYAFRWCPPGKFMMGSPPNEKGRLSDENQVSVELTQGFWMLETEVTQQMYFSVKNEIPWQRPSLGKVGPSYPAVYVDWNSAADFCKKLTTAAQRDGLLLDGEVFSLPSEAQWEYAARANTTSAYFFGNDAENLENYAWCARNADLNGEYWTYEVGTKAPNPWGFRDITGNAWEWCSDWYHEQLQGGKDPEGPASGVYRVLRGNYCRCTDVDARVAFRHHRHPETRLLIGFRIAFAGSPKNLNSENREKWLIRTGKSLATDANASVVSVIPPTLGAAKPVTPAEDSLSLTIESKEVDFHSLTITSLGIEAVDNIYAIPEFTVNGLLWRPKEKRKLLFSEIPGFDSSGFNVANARVTQIRFGFCGDVRYEYSNDAIRLGMGHVPAGGTSFKFKIVSDPQQRPYGERLPKWIGDWETDYFVFDKDRDGFPPDMTKLKVPGAVARGQVADLSDLNPKASERIETVLGKPFAISAMRRFEVEGGTYQIRSIADDGVRVFIDDNMVIDNWKIQASTLTERDIQLRPGPGKLRIEYFNDGWNRNLGLFMERID